MKLDVLNTLRSGIKRTIYQSCDYKQTNVIAAYVGYIDGCLTLFEVDKDNKTICESIIDKSVVPAESLYRVQSTRYKPFSQVGVWIREQYRLSKSKTPSESVWGHLAA